MKRTDSVQAMRLSDQIQREVAVIMAKHMGDPRLEGVSISGVRLNANMQVAEILYTLEDDPARKQEVAKAFGQANGRIRALLGKRLRGRVPELRFTLDSFLEDVIYAGTHPTSGSGDDGDAPADGGDLPHSPDH